jgi:hypothetical protein
MRTLAMAAAMLSLCACHPRARGPRKDKPIVTRVTPSGYQLVEDDGTKRNCQMMEIVGSHVPKLVCALPEEEEKERLDTQMSFQGPHQCGRIKDRGSCTGQ